MGSTSDKRKFFQSSKSKMQTKLLTQSYSIKSEDPDTPDVVINDGKTIDVEHIKPSDHELVEAHLRDSLIKAFMVIFTNDKS